jgi:hypothetical protein
MGAPCVCDWCGWPQVAERRYAIMSVFMNIPHGVVRGLATKLLYLGEEDEVSARSPFTDSRLLLT